MPEHLAAIIPAKGSPLEITKRATPKPGPGEVLVEVKSVAINPLDYYQVYAGFNIASFPSVIGTDIAGVIVEKGPDVSDDLQVGTRVIAASSCFTTRGASDYGGFQERAVVTTTRVTPLPDNIDFKEGSVLPLAIYTTWCGLYHLGVPRDAAYKPADKKALLIWGGSSSVGIVGVQVAKLLGFKTYVTASKSHHDYLRSLGADRLFDYKEANVVDNIVKAANEDGIKLHLGYHAIGDLKQSLETLLRLKGDEKAKVSSALPLAEDGPKVEGVEATFIQPPADAKEASEFFFYVYRVWLKQALEKGELVPAPKVHLVEGGLEAIQKAVDEWKKGVSCEKEDCGGDLNELTILRCLHKMESWNNITR